MENLDPNLVDIDTDETDLFNLQSKYFKTKP